MATFDIFSAGALTPLSYLVELRAGTFTVREIEGVEGLSLPFRFEARVVSEMGDYFDPEGSVGLEVTVRVSRDGADIRRVTGILSEGSFVASGKGEPELSFVIEPKFAMLRYSADARVYVDRDVPSIVKDVLDTAGIKHEMRLDASYAQRPYCVQLDECDLAFVSRLLEEEGIYYFFQEDGLMVLCDSVGGYVDLAKEHILEFRPASGLGRSREAVFEIGRRAALTTSTVTLRDWNPEKPSLDMDVTAKGPTPGGAPYYDFPGKYALPAEGDRKARILAESMAVAAAAVLGSSDSVLLAPGHTFSLTLAPEGIDDGAYVVTHVAHAWTKGQSTAVDFEAIRDAVVFRPARVTETPVVHGVLTGFVTGPDGADIHTDEYGRVKVHFPWDRHSEKDDKASHWIPVLQDNTGHSLAIPRIGWEVLVSFIEGDPDRPIVLGRVYNGGDPFPEPLPANKTVSALQSLSSPGRGGANTIRLEDKSGSQQMFIQAEKDKNVVVANDKNEKVLANETHSIGGNEMIKVGANQDVAVGASRQLNVKGDESLTVGASRMRSVALSEKNSVKKDKSLAIGASHIRRIEASDIVRGKTLKEKVGVVDLEVSLKPNSTNAGKAMMLTVGGALVEITAQEKKEKTLMLRQETVGGLVFTKAGQEVSIATAKSRTTTVGGMLMVDAMNIALQGLDRLEASTKTGELKGKTSLTLTVGGSSVTLKGGEIVVNTGGDIIIEATAADSMAVGANANFTK